MSTFGIIILAAGGSTRMGRPKQLLVYQGKTLLRRAVDAAVDSGCGPIVVVTGAVTDRACEELAGVAGIVIEFNHRWENGMGTSIRCGLARVLSEHADCAGVVLMVCDQPAVDSLHLQRLCEIHRKTGKGVVASAFGGTFGSPSLFAARWFEKLANLSDGEGAKKLIVAAADDQALVELPGGELDIDTPADFERLRGGK